MMEPEKQVDPVGELKRILNPYDWQANQMNKLRLLVEQFPDVVHADLGDGRKAVHLAASAHSRVLDLFLNNGADPYARDSEGRTTLHYAFGEEEVKLLIAAGVPINARDSRGQTPFAFQAQNGNLFNKVVEAFIAEGYEPTNGEMALLAVRMYSDLMRRIP